MERAGELRQLLDRDAIRATLTRYCRGVDRADAALLASAYHTDAVDEHGACTFSGAEIASGILAMTGNQRVTHHAITNMTIDFRSDDVAVCESYYQAWQTLLADGEERILAATGRYLDRFERRDGEWRIVHRLVVVDFATFLPDSGFTAARPDLGQRGPDDPSCALLGER
jgi:ketosteroid isomerase-like protein